MFWSYNLQSTIYIIYSTFFLHKSSACLQFFWSFIVFPHFTAISFFCYFLPPFLLFPSTKFYILFTSHRYLVISAYFPSLFIVFHLLLHLSHLFVYLFRVFLPLFFLIIFLWLRLSIWNRVWRLEFGWFCFVEFVVTTVWDKAKQAAEIWCVHRGIIVRVGAFH